MAAQPNYGERPAPRIETGAFGLPKGVTAAAVCALLGFVLTFELTSSRTSNGVVTSCSYTDVAKIGLGAAAMVLGVALLRRSLPSRNPLGLAVGIVAPLVGLYHVLTGIGMINSPC